MLECKNTSSIRLLGWIYIIHSSMIRIATMTWATSTTTLTIHIWRCVHTYVSVCVWYSECYVTERKWNYILTIGAMLNIRRAKQEQRKNEKLFKKKKMFEIDCVAHFSFLFSFIHSMFFVVVVGRCMYFSTESIFFLLLSLVRIKGIEKTKNEIYDAAQH